jgi:hypothetical protein
MKLPWLTAKLVALPNPNWNTYVNIIVWMVDSFLYFVHASIERLRHGGFLGLILPDVMLYQADTQKLRQFL